MVQIHKYCKSRHGDGLTILETLFVIVEHHVGAFFISIY
jgi:hypothetical protein